MVEIVVGARAEAVRQSAEHRLFVEGNKNEGIDPLILRELLWQWKLNLTVSPLGSSYYLKSVAEALFDHHPNYYFLIDRDHHSDTQVEESWRTFPDPTKKNLLIWRRREIENYFVEPQYFARTKYLTVDQKTIEKRLTDVAKEQVYVDICNRIIATVREECKENWIESFTGPSGLETEDRALNTLINLNEWQAKTSSTRALLKSTEIRQRFLSVRNQFLGGRTEPRVGEGEWLYMMRGKKFLNVLVSSCTRVTDSRGRPVQGREQRHTVCVDLLQNVSETDQPRDLVELRNLIKLHVQLKCPQS